MQLERGLELGRYKINAYLGGGAFADVYRAFDGVLERTVALKVLKPALLADEEAFERFVQEARTLANLHHAHIAWVWDMDSSGPHHFLAVRYVDGPHLGELIRQRGRLPWDEALAIARQVGSALDFAHGRGLVHRDVKPANILVSPEEGAVLTDFGLVKAMQASGISTRTGAILGTPQYIAPEVWQGGEAGPPADQYALACVLYEMLVGNALFDAPSDPAIMMKHFQPLVFPTRWLEEVPSGMEDVLRKALDQSPGDRFPSLDELVGALAAPGSKTRAVAAAEVQPAAPKAGARVRREGERLWVALAPDVEMAFVRVPAGMFWMGSEEGDAKAYPDEKPHHQVHLEEYWIGRYPVTHRQYQAFVEAAGHTAPDGWNGDEYPQGEADHPVVNVSWHDGRAFCQWATQISGERLRLPSEAEWEKAARGTDGRTYPWGEQEPDPGLCNFDQNIGATTAVGRYSPAGDSPYGCADMSGNVWEWTSSLFREYPYRAGDGREDPQAEEARVLRGGSWVNFDGLVRAAYRDGDVPDDSDDYDGFRCARSP